MWYTFTLLVFRDSFQLLIQIGDLRNNQVVFTVNDNDIQRGSLGIGSDGNDDFYIDGIYIDNYEANKGGAYTQSGTDVRNFDNIKKENTKNHRNKYCKSLYMGQTDKMMKCRDFHKYCYLRCDEVVHKRENILLYTCYKGCVNDSLMKEKMENLAMNDEVGYGLNNNIWSPKEKDKCDYKPDEAGDSSWVPCYIDEAKSNANDPEQKFLTLKYKVGDKIKRKMVLYPSSTLKECGSMLKTRNDCSKTNILWPVILPNA